MSLIKKAEWIAKEEDLDFDDVYDCLLGNLTRPLKFVEVVESAAYLYDDIKDRNGHLN